MKKIFSFLFFIGLLLIISSGYLAYNTWSFQKNAIHTEGEITDLRYSKDSDSSSGSWFPTVTFTDNKDQEITFESSVGGSGYRGTQGEIVDVIYENGHSENAKIENNGLYFGAIFCGIFALVFTLIGGAGRYLLNRGNKHIKLMQTGRPLSAQIIEVGQNESIVVNGESPWRITCQYLDTKTNKVYSFKSANIFYDPTPYINNDKITVYVDDDNLKKYYVDISHLPEKA
ncbi:MAG: DUF3592 domain-containing protein [Enterobacteriaceae bacterium]|jgi:hypothetical protein|nr:DUF3592 domain-containing protein [Enterobacteriaceae bacterium]